MKKTGGQKISSLGPECIFLSKRDHESTLTTVIQQALRGFPGGSVVENLPADAGDTGLIPGPHAEEQLNPCATTTKPVP